MKEKKIEITYCSVDPAELPVEDRELIEKAKSMTYSSYAPYSRFCVGAAIRMADGSIACGSNQENAAFPSSLCAERTACFHASATHPGMPMKKIAIAARNIGIVPKGCEDSAPFQAKPISPCGACRQALLEYEHLHGPIQVILYGDEESFIFPSVESLLPFSFTNF
ncbi:MAG: cytidine deaminase [Muribaculaceae bacterium]|nr:cytidine deaminase [Muribaculaceae bacterium]